MALAPVAALSSSAKAATSTEGINPLPVKQERDDDAEIAEMAAKMVEQNKAKMASAPTATAGRTSGLVGPGQPSIMGFLNRTKAHQSSSPVSEKKKSEKPAIDEQSQRGRFGWETLGKTHIPYISRAPNDKYCAVRMVEQKLLSKYLNYLHSDIYSCTCIRSYYITEAEARLLNEINVKHCEVQFGRDNFTTKDLVVRLQDAKEFYNFLDVCYNKLAHCGVDAKDKCGFIRINNESVVPYTVKDTNKYVPLFYFEGETDNLKLKAEKLESWDLAYLKFCCKVQGIRNELFASETCSVISLSDIKSYFPAGTVFEDYWPNKVVDSSQLLITQKGNGQPCVASSWIKAPPGSVPTQASTVVVNKVTPSHTPRTGSIPPQQTTVSPQQTTPQTQQPQQQHQQSLHNGWPGLVGGQPTYQPIVSQAQQNIRMGQMNMSLHNLNQATNSSRSYQPPRATMSTTAQYYPTPHQLSSLGQSQVSVPQPPPLVRVTAPAPTMGYHSYGKDDWNSTYSTSSMNIIPSGGSMHLIGLQDRAGSMLPPPPHLQYPSHNNNTTQANSQQSQQQQGGKYPPPLIPVVNGSTNQRYHHYAAPGAEVIDLSSPPQSPSQRLQVMGNGTQQQQQQQQQQAQPPPAHTDPNGSMRKLIPIMEAAPTSGSHFPYKVQKAYVSEKMVPCINAKPFTYSELLITLPDLVSYFFPNVAASRCRDALHALEIKLYQGNSHQMQVLKENQKCKTVKDPLPLIQLRDIGQFMTQLRYILESPQMSSSSSEIAAKRQRTS